MGGQHKRELGDLRQAKGHQRGRGVVEAVVEGEEHEGARVLHRHDQRRQRHEPSNLAQQEGRVDVQAHGHEENAGEHVTNGFHNLHRVLSLLWVNTDHKACNEAAQLHGQSQVLCQLKHGHHDADGTQQVELLRPFEVGQDRRDHFPGGHGGHDERHDEPHEDALQRLDDSIGATAGVEDRQEGEHDPEGDVLDDEDPQQRGPVLRRGLGGLQALQHNRR
mmetsp:Transcript_112052/g.194557  ORF Transcript_112052/g.194557 Transcript_112052/m.194557 type:complete len:220 (+) Transcript_112052:436-1095(+)